MNLRAANALHDGDANCPLVSSLDANLQEVVAVWNGVPRIIRQAILMFARQCDEKSDRI